MIPHIGWNNVSIKKKHYLFNGIEDNALFIFYIHIASLKLKDNILLLRPIMERIL